MSMPVEPITEQTDQQYGLGKIIAIWAIASLPMLFLTRWVAPALTLRVKIHPGILFWWMTILGMVWQFTVSMWIVKKEEGNLRWSTLKQRFWLTTPKDPKTGEPRAKLFWWLLPGIALAGILIIVAGPLVNNFQAMLFPSLTTPPNSDMAALATSEFVGAWWVVGIAVISSVFNYFLGEEFLFRGVLLPKMRGVFGKWDWLANSVLFGFYHLHWAPSILSLILSTLPGNYLSSRYRSSWFEVIIHGVEAIPLFMGILAVVMGFA